MNFTEFVDFALVRLYELDKEGTTKRINIAEIAKELREPVPADWSDDALRILDQKGWAKDWELDQIPLGEITPQGRLYVEGRAGRHQTRMIDEYRQEPSNYVFIFGSDNQVAVGNRGPVSQTHIASEKRAEARELLKTMREQLEADEAIDDSAREQALADVAAVEDELETDEPDPDAIKRRLDVLSKIASVGSFAIKVGELVSG